MSLDQNPVNLEIKAPFKVDLGDYDLLQTLGAGKYIPTCQLTPSPVTKPPSSPFTKNIVFLGEEAMAGVNWVYKSAL